MDGIDPNFLLVMRITIIGGLLAFFIPSIIAFARRIKVKWIIFVLNLLFGFSFFFAGTTIELNFLYMCARFLFWIIALIWACAAKKEEKNLNITGGENE